MKAAAPLRRTSALVLLCMAAGALLLAGCGEKAQTKTARKSDAAASAGAVAAYSAPGWKAGDGNSWEQQIKARTQSQNEYLRTGAH